MGIVNKIRQSAAMRKLEQAANRHKLPAALVVAISATLVLTVVSVGLYYGGGFYRYDLSRPGYEKERTEISRPSAQKDYDTTSQVTKATIDEFLQEFDVRQKDLKAYGDFRDASLTDEDLQLTQD